MKKKQNKTTSLSELNYSQPFEKSSLKYLLERPLIPGFRLGFDLDYVIQIRYLAF